MCLSRFWGNARKEGQEFRSLEVREAGGELIALKKWKVVAAGSLKNGKSKQKAKK